MQEKQLSAFGLKKNSRIKDFTFKSIAVPAKWVKTARRYVLNLYTDKPMPLSSKQILDNKR